jgi:hypothetical protein
VPRPGGGDECEKGICHSSRLSKNLPACTKHFDEGRFGEQASEGGYASAGLVEAVNMPCAEARGASLHLWIGLKESVGIRGFKKQEFKNLVEFFDFKILEADKPGPSGTIVE